MFRYNQKRANKEVDELKKLLAITKGYSRKGESISSKFLKEDVDPSQQTSEPVSPEAPIPPVGGEEAKTDDQSAIEQAIENSTIEFTGPEDGKETVKGYVQASNDDNEKLHFKFVNDNPNPLIKSEKSNSGEDTNIELNDDLLKSLQQIKAYFETWKDNLKKGNPAI